MAKKNPAATAEDLTLDSALDGGDKASQRCG